MDTNIKNRGFFWSNKAVYKDVIGRPEILFGLYPEEGGTYGEMKIGWVDLGEYGICPRLEIFGDSVQVFASFPDVLTEMTKLPNLYTQEQFVEVLKKCHFRDLTAYGKEIK